MTKEELLQSVSVEEMTESIASNSIFDAVNLSEDVKGSLVTVIDRAVKSLVEKNLDSMADKLIESNEQLIESAVNEKVEAELSTLTESMDDFCTGVADKYLDENSEAIENNIKANMFENILHGLIGIIQNNNIEIDESKIDVVDELMEELDESNQTVKFLTSAYTTVKNDLSEMKQENILNTILGSKELTENQKESVKEIALGADCDEKTFETVVESIIDLVKNSNDATINENQAPDTSEADGLNYIPENSITEATKAPAVSRYQTL